jgi:hypothetical protein
MELELNKLDWAKSKEENELLIVNNRLQIEMATEVIKLCDRRIAEFEARDKAKK